MVKSDWLKGAGAFGLNNVTYSSKKLKIVTPDLISGIRYLDSMKIDNASIDFKDGISFFQVPIDAPRPKPKYPEPSTLSRFMAVLDQHSVRNVAEFGLRDVCNIRNKIVGEISDTKTFVDHLNSQRMQLKIRDNTVYIGDFPTVDAAEDYFALIK